MTTLRHWCNWTSGTEALFWWAWQKPRLSALQKISLWWGYIILKGIFLPIILKIPYLEPAIFMPWYPVVIPIPLSRITENLKFLQEPEMMRQERLLIRWLVPLVWVIRAAKIDRLSKEGNPYAMNFPKAKVEDAPYDFSFSGVKLWF